CLISLFPGALLRGESFFERDIQAFYRPAKSLLVPLARGSAGLPLWNPYLALGQPFAANPEHELFHPLTALFFLLPFEWAFRLQFLLPLLGAALSMFFLLDSFGLGFEAATFGGLAWGFGGYTLSTTNLLPILFAIAVLPAVLAFSVRFVTRGRSRDLAGLALMIGLECLAGEPSTLLMTALLLPASLVHVTLADGEGARLRRALPRLLGGLLLGGALGAVTLIPGLHHASKTVRAGGLPDLVADKWSLPPVRLLEFVAPRILGHIDQADERWYWGGALYPDRNYPFLYSIYPGLLVALLAGAAVNRGPPGRWVWVGTAVLGALLAVGAHLPFWHLARSVVPGLKGLRYPEKFILLTVFAAVVLAGSGFEELLRGRTDLRRRLFRSLAVVGLLATLAGLLLVALDVLQGTRLWVSRGISPAIAASWASVAGGDAIRIGATAAAGLAVLVVFRRASWPLILVAAADLVLAGRPLVPTKPSNRLSGVPPFLAPLVRARPPGPLFHFAAWDPQLGTTTGICKPPLPAQWGIPTTLEEDFDLTELRWSHRATRAFLEAIRADPTLLPPLLQRRGVAAVLRFRPGLSGSVGERLAVGPEGPLILLLTRNPSPLVFCASRLIPGAGEDGWRDAVRRLGRDAALAAVVDPRDLEPFPGKVSQGTVDGILMKPGRVDFDVAVMGPEPAFVAVNQTWDEGWRARVDGVSAKLVRADLSLSGLVVPAGRHRVALSYEDPWVTAGLAMSLAALAVVLLLLRTGRAGRGRPVTP
ncbi:MAG TPA: hypothetical protein VL084_02990, partial [Thermoanaerobaculia bacterium]|nr:hypothetical protein [Thermoanaerobaculia bacterium]